MRPRSWLTDRADVVVVAAIACAAAAVVLLAPSLTPLRAVLGLVLVLAAPGYALVAAMFGDDRPEFAMQVVLSLALSIALCIAAALGLDVAGVELTARTFTLALSGIALVAAGVAAVRHHDRGATAYALPAPMRMWVVVLALLVGVFAGVLVVLRQPLPDPAAEGYTALSATRPSPSKVRFTIHNQEQRAVRYHVQIIEFSRPAGRHVIGRADPRLAPGHRLSDVVSTVPSGRALPVKVRLYRADAPDTIYRSVYLQP
ncbi:MAG: hypothetical protein QOG15_1517 [Solirubrobacteraceae bacterium]|jgi:uncharacterized membrane protein HdeD (DUF308 family)|nr:hypothetical protein [Solirubrobacteraceae bacterium]